MILSYLYNREDGANAHNIQFHGVIGRTMEGSRFKKLLEELCDLQRIEKHDMSYVTEGRMIYKITEKGRKTIEALRDPLIKDVLGFSEKEI
jgi:predicted transcriptional regulator